MPFSHSRIFSFQAPSNICSLERPGLTSLYVSVGDSHITSVPIPVLEGIWHKAEELICTPGLIMDAPTSSIATQRCFVVASKSSACPRIVQCGRSAHFSCEPSCPMWHSSKICPHSMAEFCGELREFIHLFNASKSALNLDKLSRVGMPKGSGRKGKKPPRKCKRSAQQAPLISL